MSAVSRRAVSIAVVLPLVVALQQWPALPAMAAPWRAAVQQVKSVDVLAAGKVSARTTSVAKFSPAAVEWPSAQEATVDLGRGGELVRAEGTPFRLSAGTAKSGARATVRVLDRQTSDRLVGPGVVAVLTAAQGAETTVSLDYGSFAAAAGAGYASRLRLVALPTCALTTPELSECTLQTDLGSANDEANQTLTATVTASSSETAPSDSDPSPSPTVQPSQPPTPTASGTPTASTEPTEAPPARPTTDDNADAGLATVVVAAAAAASSDQGDYTATSLKPSSTWTGGRSSGEFGWSYPLRAPSVPGALSPDLAVTYSSGGTDGGVSNTNNQASWVGEGFDLATSFIERKYNNCYDDRSDGTNKTSNAVDLCWYTDAKKTNDQKWDNAFLSMQGHAGELVRDANTANWRLEKDDGTRIAKIGTAASNNEYWRVSTPDGTQYYFGKGRSDTATADPTNSVWKVPVAGNHSGEPGYDSSFASSFDPRPWRWNLDYVVSPTGNTVTYYYTKEANKYKKNLATSTSYDRGGYLTRIQYGELKGSETVDDSPAKVTFTVEERCDTSISSSCLTATPTSSTAKAWPDVPMDAYCQTYCPDQKYSPTFFSRKRVAQVDTFARNAAGAAWEAVDTWVFGKSFPKPADGAAVPSLWLSSITHTGKAGTSIALPAVTLTPMMLDSRIKGSGGVALEKPRLAVVTSETGAQTIVEYSHPECTASTVPSEAGIPGNTTRCMPVWYSSGSASPTLQWFNKYVTTSVTERDLVAQSDVNLEPLDLDISGDVVATYSYEGGGAWRYNDSPMVKAKYRTWGEWRGYGKVTAAIGSGSTQNVTQTTYFRGINGDRATKDGGSKSVTVTDSTGISRPDEDWFAGMVREVRTFRSAGGAEDSGTINDPAATQRFSDGRLTSRQVDISETRTRQALASGGVRSGSDRTLEWDSYGQPTLSEAEGDTSVTGDETCTRASYATPSDAGAGPVNHVAQITTMPALCSTPVDTNQVISAVRHYYGSATLGTVASNGLETKIEELTGSGTSRAWTVTAQTGYDQWGRVTATTDTLGNTSSTSFTHTTGGLLSTMATTTTDPDGAGSATPLTTTVTFDTRSGTPVKTVQPGGQTTESTLDALGRVVAVWQPGRAKATQSASATYDYAINKTGPSTVTTQSLLPSGSTYQTSVSLLDSYLRARQTQTQSAAGGRIVTDTRRDSRGNAVLVDTYYNLTPPATALVQPASRTSILNSHRYSFDFAGRQIRDGFYSEESQQWETLNSYKGDRVASTPPPGGTPTTTVTDIQGRTTQLIQHLGTDTGAPGVATSYRYDPAGNLVQMTDAKANRWDYTYDLAGNRLTARDPDKGLSTSTYNAANQLISTTDARGITLKYFYDNLGRDTRTTKADGVTALTSTVYDTVKKGLPSSSSRHLDGGTITSRVDSYDTAGRATSATMVVPEIGGRIPSQLAGNYTTTTSYNADGTVNTQTLPAAGPIPAETLSFGYTSLTGLPDTLTGSLGSTVATYVSDTQYLQWGTIAAMVLGTHAGKSVMASYTRDQATLRLTGSQLNRQVNPGVTDENTAISYDPAGNITQVTATEADGQVDNQCFTYDYQQQLTEAWSPSGTGCDADGRNQAALSGPAPYWTSWMTDTTGKTVSRTDRTPTTSSITALTYPGDGTDSVTPHFITGTTTTGSTTGTASYTADASGNTVSRPGTGGNQQTLVWDETNQLTEVKEGDETVARMVYDASGNRILRQEAQTTTLYLGGSELTITGSGAQPPLEAGTATVSALRYYTHAGQAVAVRGGASNDTVTTMVLDWQGTTHHQVSNATGQLRTVWQDPYGRQRGATPGSWTGERSFVGGTKDATDLIRVGARDYDTALQRFVTVDPVQDLNEPLQWNPYLYANNTPITKSDPTGLRTPPDDGPPPVPGNGSGGRDTDPPGNEPGDSNSNTGSKSQYTLGYEHGQRIIQLRALYFARANQINQACLASASISTGACQAASRDNDSWYDQAKTRLDAIAALEGYNPSDPEAITGRDNGTWDAGLAESATLIYSDLVFGGASTLGSRTGAIIKSATGEAGQAAVKSLATGADEAVFWSGLGAKGEDLATAWVAKNGGATLETTLASRGITLPKYDVSNPASVAAWRDASYEFAAGARGNVRVLQADAVRIDSTWAQVEYKALTSNPNVTSITGVNPTTGASTPLWSR